MISLGRAFARQAVDDAFLRLIRRSADDLIATRDAAAFHRDVEELCEARARATRAIDSDLPR